MTRCADIEPLLYLFRSGELSPEERARVDVHLRTCSACAAVIADLRANNEALRPLRERPADESAPSAAVDAILDRIGTRPFTHSHAHSLTRSPFDSLRSLRVTPAHPHTRKREHSHTAVLHLLDRILRPALELALAAAILLLAVQGIRDARSTSRLEQRIAVRGDEALRTVSAAEQTIARYERDSVHRSSRRPGFFAAVLPPVGDASIALGNEDLAALLRSAPPEVRQAARLLQHAATTQR